MNQIQRALRFILIGAWAILMTALTYVLGAASLKVLRRRMGRLGYWGLLVPVSVALYFLNLKLLGIGFLSLVILIGVFSEMEELGFPLLTSAFLTLLINTLLGAGAFALWVSSTGKLWSQQVLQFLEASLKPLIDLNPAVQISYSDLMTQLPSVVLIMWMGALYLAILLEGTLLPLEDSRETPTQTPIPQQPFGSATGHAFSHPTMRAQLATLQLPDVCVWLLIISLLGAFGQFGIRTLEAVSVNAVNVCFVLFFFQGAAVLSKFFTSMRMGWFWQFLFMLIIVVHLFLLVSLLGLLDYWFDFRNRLTKRAGQTKSEI